MKTNSCIKALLLFALSVILCVALISCNNTAGGSDSDSSSTEESVNIPKDRFAVLFSGKSQCRIIYTDIGDGTEKSVALDIRNEIEKLTSVTPELFDDYTEDNGSFEILVGKTNRDESKSTEIEDTDAAYSVCVINNKLVITAVGPDGYFTAMKTLKKLLSDSYDSEKKELLIETSFNDTGIGATKEARLLTYETAGKTEKIWDCGDEAIMRIVKNTTLDEYNAYLKLLSEDGNTLYAENKIGETLFSTYLSEDERYVINTIFTPHDKRAKVIIEPMSLTSLPDKESEKTDKVCEPTITQLGLEHIYYHTNSTPQISYAYFQAGMGYIIRLENGTFIVIDGGLNSAHSYDKFLNTVRSQAPDPEKIVISAWIITHAHDDHTGVFERFSGDGSAKKLITVERLIYHFPSDESYKKTGDSLPTALKQKLRSFKDAKITKAHPGQRFYIGGAVIEIYSTMDMTAPLKVSDPNSLSMAFTVTVGGQKLMFLADATDTVANYMLKAYGDALKSDMVQAAHHGTGATSSFYEAVDPTVVFFPTGEWDYHYYWNGEGKKSYASNAYFYTSKNLKEIILAGSTDRTLTLPYDNGNVPFPIAPPKDSFK